MSTENEAFWGMNRFIESLEQLDGRPALVALGPLA